MASKTNKTSHSNYETLETFSLIWLDSHVNKSEDNEKIQQKLQQIITHLKTFDDPQECQEYISSLSSKNRVILIISGRFGRELLPHIHSFPQIVAVYVFCMDKQANEQWAKEYSKVKSVVVRAKDLIAEIKTYEKSPENVEEPLLFSVSSGDGHSTTDINGHFVHFLLLIDVLLRIKPDEVDKASLIKRCKEKNRDHPEEVLNISKFKHEYTAENALQWYTRDSFLYKMLNQALRFQDIDLLFLFRFVIADMCRQLKEFQYQTRVKVYRGQIMSKGELDTLQQSKGKLISINSFFSTSIVPKEALRFLESASFSNDSQRILFVIDADPNVVKSKPFADLSEVSEYEKEKEVLFMVGCVFRLNDVQRNKEQIWEIKMELCGDDNHDLKILFDHMKAKYGGGDGEVNLRSFGEVLRKMGKFDAAETMYQRLRSELSDGDPQLFSLYYSLGQVTLEKAQYDESLKWFQQSLEIIMRTDSSNYVDIAAVYGWIGNVYLKKDVIV
ncbi:hypothetical protein I4U23_012648 [Adineta vaga]|nr:hypothetical protein I4U23_012648 [Adineta vaga]